ncbi:MAG: hypothetical protein QOE70_5315 [Chthoniobacter sp.]|jgi:hypothetical protein|nr:hypothetical protein [Chthoniobacter sp.]
MKLLVATLFLTLTLSAQAGEYRFQCLGEVTGLCDIVYDKDGKETTIKIDYGDPESAAIFLALQKKRIYGTNGFKEHMGVKWMQEIHLLGEFTSEMKRTPSGPGMAASEPYRDFRMTGIKLVFPVWRFQEASVDQVDPPVFLETHFDFDSLFPQGLKLEGKQIDLKKHAIDHTR